LEILIMGNSSKAIIVFSRDVGIEVIQKWFHASIQNPQHLFRFVLTSQSKKSSWLYKSPCCLLSP
jgi:hypothetical protein